MIPLLNRFWQRLKIIPVEEFGGSAALREAFRHLASGGIVGIFPEGRIARPHGRIQLFHPGLAMIAARTKLPLRFSYSTEFPLVEIHSGVFFAEVARACV